MKELPALAEKHNIINSAKYRNGLALNLFYKFFLSLQDEIPARLKSATEETVREPSSGTQTFDTPEK